MMIPIREKGGSRDLRETVMVICGMNSMGIIMIFMILTPMRIIMIMIIKMIMTIMIITMMTRIWNSREGR